jgi:uncharacterized protein (DUF2252 family)
METMQLDRDPDSHPTVAQRRERGKQAREVSPRSAAGDWEPAADRQDPVAIIEEGTKTAIPSLVPIRYGRMSASPFTFYRGTAAIMAADLRPTAVTGINAQLCGDAHLSNFGLFGAPDRSIVFDINDFDETLAGPWEWDLKRLATSFVLSARESGWDAAAQHAMAANSAMRYREAMRRFAEMDNLNLWYSRLDTDRIAELQKPTKEGKRTIKKALGKDSERAVRKLSEVVDGRRQIVHQPPLLVPFKEFVDPSESDRVTEAIRELFGKYRASLQSNRQHLIDSYQFVDLALKVVGVGSVGSRAFTALLQGHDEEDLLFVQIKEAGKSALAQYGGLSWRRDPGRRVVEGQRLMQATSDIMLGWASGGGYHFYFRQLWDMKGSFDASLAGKSAMQKFANLCGWTLARAHARSGDRIAIARYLGKGETFDTAIADFAMRYADQAERDYEAFMAAGDSGRIELDTSANK